jgi:hypothetical protein
MTWRAFIIGIIGVVLVCVSDPYTSFAKGYGWNTIGHFPSGAVFLLVFLTVGANALLQALRRGWALRQAELMLVWCMVLVASIVPSDGLMRWFPPMLAGPAYLAGRADIRWQDTALAEVPADLLLTKSPASEVAKRFFEGNPPGAQVPWEQWYTPLATWAVFLLLFYFATMFLCAVLRRQWVDRERLQFPLARVPLDFTEGSGERGLLSDIFHNRAFLLGLAVTAAFRLLRDLPLFFGATRGWNVQLPFQDVLSGTPLQQLYLQNFDLWWSAIGFAFLVPADVSLSIWFFYLFGRAELQAAYWAGSDLQAGGTWSPLLSWEMTGAYMAFTVGALAMARRHLLDVVRKAFGAARDVDDSAEPVRFSLAFWGLLLCTAGGAAWSVYFGMRLWASALLFLVMLSIMLVNARIVAQSGLYNTTCPWSPAGVLHGLSFGHLFGMRGIALSRIENALLIDGNYSLLGPAAIHSFRIADAMKERRRWLLPALLVALVVGFGASTYMGVWQGYHMGALNFSDTWGATGKPKATFDVIHNAMQRPEEVDVARWTPFIIGIVLTGFVMFMRGRFFWWPIHPVGLLSMSNWHMDRLWMPFFLGWLIKTFLMKFAGGRALRQARYFFIALIIVENAVGGVSTVVRLITKGAVPGF